MSEFLFQYHTINPTTWVYVSSLLLIGLYFKFGRFWSVRNLDLVLLILLAPGLLAVHFGLEIEQSALRREASPPVDGLKENGVPSPAPLARETGAGALDSALAIANPSAGLLAVEPPGAPPSELDPLEAAPVDDPLDDPVGDAAALDALPSAGANLPGEPVVDPALARGRRAQMIGYIWLFVGGALILIRLLLDPTMVRRPLLEPNLSVGGLTFIGCSLFLFLMANVIVSTPTEDDLRGPRGAQQLMAGELEPGEDEGLSRQGPGLWLISLFPSLPTSTLLPTPKELPPREQQQIGFIVAAKAMAILSHLAVVLGMVVIGYRHFDNVKTGIGAATLYLMLPYTAQMTGRVEHVLPAALLVWAIVYYRKPLTAGLLLGLAAGVIYYPLFLLPLWISFYWQRGLLRFIVGVLSMLAVVVLALAITSSDMASFWLRFQRMFGLWLPRQDGLQGIWDLAWYPVYRIPVLAGFVALCCSFAIWPAQKNLGTLLSCSAVVMLGTQFWHGFGGGTYMAWYLPLLLLTIMRPNLEDRVALSVLGEGWFPKRRLRLHAEQAA